MGQRVGKAALSPCASCLIHLPHDCVMRLWSSFNDVAEGFGLKMEDFLSICSSAKLQELRKLSSEEMKVMCSKVFEEFDTDSNGLVDALELLATIAMLSGMPISKKIDFVFRAYDFDQSGKLTVDEMTLALKSTTTGLCKISSEDLPSESNFERISAEAFKRASQNDKNQIEMKEFTYFCVHEPEVRSWIEYFEDPSTKNTASCVDSNNLTPDFKPKEIIFEHAHDIRLASSSPLLSVSSLSSVKNVSAPSKLPPEHIGRQYPSSPFRLEWVHGFRCKDVCNNLRYNSSGKILFHAGAVSVVMDKASNTQKINSVHSNDIVAMDVFIPKDHSCTYVATGEVGMNPRIVIWDGDTSETLGVVRGFQKKAVIHLSFDETGRKLVAIGHDNSVVLYTLKPRAPRGFDIVRTFASVSPYSVLVASFVGKDRFASCGSGFVDFWSIEDRDTYRRKSGLWGKIVSSDTITLCVSAHPNQVDGEVVTGSKSGDLLVWSGRNCVKQINAHFKALNAMYVVPGVGLVTGGADGRVQLWNIRLQRGADFDMSNFNSIYPSVQSVCWIPDAHKVLVGTRGGEILEFADTDGNNLNDGALVQAHFEGQIWGLATNSRGNEYATTGDDGTVRIWDSDSHCKAMTRLTGPCRCVAFSRDGSHVVVGMGIPGNHNHPKTGSFVAIKLDTMTVVHEARDSVKALNVVRFSADGTILAVGSEDGVIYLYNAADAEFSDRCRIESHRAPVKHFDFSADGRIIRSQDASGTVLYHRTEDGETYHFSRKVRLGDMKFCTSTCTLNDWSSKGTWSNLPVTTSARSQKQDLVATGDKVGRIRLWAYPCFSETASSSMLMGHADIVTNLCWIDNDSCILSTGGSDLCVFRWRRESSHSNHDVQDSKFIEDEELGCDLGSGLDMYGRDEEQTCANEEVPSLEKPSSTSTQQQQRQQWSTVIAPPVVKQVERLDQPDANLTLNWIHGYSSEKLRSCIHYSHSGNVIYPAARLGVSLNKDVWTQHFMQVHTDDVTAIAMHPSKQYVATGQAGRNPLIVIWNADTLEILQTFRMGNDGIDLLSFSSDGMYLVLVDMRRDMVMLDWNGGFEVASAKVFDKRPLALAWSPRGDFFVLTGFDGVYFCRRDGRNILLHRGLINDRGQNQPMLSVGFVDGDAVCGTIDGHLYKFDSKGMLEFSTKAHVGAVVSLYTVPGKGICSGGKDGVIKIWNSQLECLREFSVASLENPPLNAHIRSICWNAKLARILIGTRSSEIYEISDRTGKVVEHPKTKTSSLVSGHFENEMCGLAMHPSKELVLTVGDDRTVCIFDLNDRICVARKRLSCAMRCATFSPKGDLVAIGLGGKSSNGQKNQKEGCVLVLDTKDLSVVTEIHDSLHWIQCVQFSPDAETLAVGSRDKTVYFYNIKDEYGLQATFTGHKAGVTRIDFSECSQYVRSNSSDYNLLFSNVLDGKAISQSSTMRDTTWATQDCILSWNTKGLHNNMTARSVLATDVSKSSELLVSADTFGNVQLRHYPCLSSKKQFKNYKGHSSEVRNVKFSMSDTYIVSCGANDRCVFQWVLEKNEILESKRGVVMGSDTLASYGDLNMETKLYEEETKEEEEEEEERSKTSSKSKSAWKGSIVEPSPSEKTRSDETAPNEVQVTLEHVYGYRSRDCRSNMFYNASDNLVYPAGSIGVVYDKRVHKQCFYRGHRGADITALTMDSRRCYVASAQHGDAKRAAEIHIWDSQSCAPISVCAPFHRGSVVALAFSHCSHKLVSLGVHGRMALWCSTSGLWNDIERRASANTPNTASSRVLFVQFCSHLRSTEFEIATGGLGHVTFWNSKLEPQKAVYCKNPIAPMLCGAILSNHLVCGSFTGKIYKFHPGTRQCVRVVDAHNGSVNSMFSIPDGSCLVSGAKCGSVIVWNADLSVRAKYDLLRIPESIVPILPEVRSVCMNEFGVVIAGTSSSDVYQLFGQNKSSQLLQAHFEGELRGLSAHPVDSKLFATSGDDKTVRIWNSSTKKLITMQKLDMPSRACTFSNCGSRIVCGFGAKSDTGGTTKNGAYVVFESKDMTLVHEDRPSRVAITALRYSTSGDHIAIVSDKKIYITSSLDFQTRAVVSNHNSAVTHFDFSADSKHLRTNTAQNELKFFNSSDGKEIKSASSLKDCEWSSTTCPLVWSTQGLHGVTSSSERRKVICVDRFETLLASGDESGEIRLHRFPCVNDKAESICLLGHGSEVSSLKFSSDGTMLYSVGARDRVICQWCVSGVNTSSQSESSSKEEDFSSSKEADMPIGVG